MRIKLCCIGLRLAVKGKVIFYNAILEVFDFDSTGKVIPGYLITYCPFCGTKLEVK